MTMLTVRLKRIGLKFSVGVLETGEKLFFPTKSLPPKAVVNDYLFLMYSGPYAKSKVPHVTITKTLISNQVWWRINRNMRKRYDWLPDENPLVSITQVFFEKCRPMDKTNCLLARKLRKFIPDAMVTDGQFFMDVLGPRYGFSDLAYMHEKAFERSQGDWRRYRAMCPNLRFNLFPSSYYS